MNVAAALLQWLRRLESVAAALAYSAVALLLIADVLGREFFGQSIFGAQKIAVFFAVIAGFLGLSLATSAGTHLRPALLDRLFPASFDATIQRLSDAFSSAVYLSLAIIAFEFVNVSMQAGDRAAVLYWVLWPIQTVIPYALLSCAFQHCLFAIWPTLRPSSTEPAAH